MGEQVERRLRRAPRRGIRERVAAELLAQRPLVERELDVERGRQRLLHLGDRLVGEALRLQRRVIDAGRIARDCRGRPHRPRSRRSRSRGSRARAGFRHRAVDDLEVAAAGELLELHQREVGLDAGGVAIHHQADGAGRRDHGRLRIAIAVLLAERERASQARLACDDQTPDRGRPHGRAAPAAARPSRSRSSRHRRRGDGCASRAACARGFSCSPGTGRAPPPSRPRSRRRRRS